MICKAPFTSQVVWTSGEVQMCCNDQPSEKQYSLEDEWNSESRKQARREWLSGEIPDRCKSCVKRMESGDATLPVWYDKIIETVELTEEVSMPVYLHMSPSNQCNLACRMCNGEISSTYDKLICDSSNGERHNDIVEYVKKCLPKLEHYVFHGGDPMFYKDFLRVVEVLKGRKDDLYINVITNGTHHKSDGVDMIPHLKEFKNLKVTFSIDSIGKYNDYMRTLTKTSRVVDNFNKWCREVPHAEMSIHTITTNISSLGIVEHLRNIYNSDMFDRVDAFSHFMVDWPVEYRVHNQPPAMRQRVLDSINEFRDEVESYIGADIETAKNILINIERQFERPFDIKEWAMFLKKNKEHDVLSKSDTSIIEIMKV